MRSNTFSHTPIYPFIHETIKPLPPVHGIKTAYHNDSIKYKDKYFLNLTVSRILTFKYRVLYFYRNYLRINL